jgi:FkbM family methyltransferase
MFDWLDLVWTTRTGLQLRVGSYTEWVIYNEIFVDGDYDRALSLALAARPDQTTALRIVDVGAHVGFFTLRAVDRALHHGWSRSAVTIRAFEAHPARIRDFEARVLDANQLRSSVRLVPGLIGEPAGSGAFYDDAFTHRTQGGKPLTATYIDLSAALADLPQIDLLKCDIEGSEQRLLENYADVLRRTRVAVFELHRDECDVARCRDLLREYGFGHAAAMGEEHPYSIYTVWR